MKIENPYNSPRATDDSASPSVLFWTIGAVFGTSLLGGVLGTSLGAALGAVVPGYYRSVFPNGDSPNFDPVAVGIGQGLTQGVFFGAVVGVILVAMYYRFRWRSQHRT